MPEQPQTNQSAAEVIASLFSDADVDVKFEGGACTITGLDMCSTGTVTFPLDKIQMMHRAAKESRHG